MIDRWKCVVCYWNNEYERGEPYVCPNCGAVYNESEVYELCLWYDDTRQISILLEPHDKDGNLIGCGVAVFFQHDVAGRKLWEIEPVVYGELEDMLILTRQLIQKKRELVLALINKRKE